MKRLLIVCAVVLTLGFMTESTLAIEYCKDVLEPGNSGGWGTSTKTFDEEITMGITEEVDVDIWLNDCPQNILAAGFWIIYDPALLSVVSVNAYDNGALPGPWDYSLTSIISEPAGPGSYYCILARFGSGVVPDTDGDIILGKVRFRCEAEGDATFTVIPIPHFDTNVGWPSITVYDHQMTPNIVTIHQIIAPCCTYISPDPTKVFSGETMQFTANKTGTCNTPSYVWSSDCENGIINPATGMFTIEMIETEEKCSVCVIDNANPSSCTDSDCDPPADCCANFIITNDGDDDGIADEQDNCPNHPNGPDLGTCIYGGDIGTTCTSSEECGTGGFCTMDQEDNFPPGGNGIGEACECEGDFDADGDCDGTDAVTFKADFGRSGYSNPCPTQ